jgi:hypothetical protein
VALPTSATTNQFVPGLQANTDPNQDPKTYWWGVVELNKKLQLQATDQTKYIKELEAEVETQVNHKLAILQQKNTEIERLRERVKELEAEVAKSVRVPDGWLLLKPDTVNYHIGWLGKYYAVVDPETMPEKATATQSKLDDCEACLDDCNVLVAELRKSLQDERKFAEKKQADAERLRKAIESHRADGGTCNFYYRNRDKALYAALTPSPAASGETESVSGGANYARERHLDANYSRPTSAPAAAASGERDTKRKIGKCARCGGKLLNGHKCPPQFKPTSAPAAESGEELVTPERLQEISAETKAEVAEDMAGVDYEALDASAPAAESEPQLDVIHWNTTGTPAPGGEHGFGG